jgi:tetratricopeptide (TPR) repeat protein
MNPTNENRLFFSPYNIGWKGITLCLCLFLLWPLPVLSHEAGNLYREALSAVESQDFNTAKPLLEQAIQEFPTFAEAHHLYGLVEFHLTQQPERAIPSLQQAIRHNPNLAQAQYDVALLLIKQEKMKEAQEAAQQALTIYPRFLGGPAHSRQTLRPAGINEAGYSGIPDRSYPTTLTSGSA